MSGTRVGIEENTLVILDSLGKYNPHADDDRITFLEAVRSNCLMPESPIRPTRRMFEAVFDILRVAKPVELIMASFELLNDLEKIFPRVCLSSSNGSLELAVAEEGWSPVVLESEAADKNSTGPLDSSGFHLLMQKIAEGDTKTNVQALDTQVLGNMMLFQYLVNSLEADFLLRNNVFKETMNWVLLRESSLNMLLGSRRVSFRGLMKDCVSILCTLSQVQAPEDSAANHPENFDTAMAIANAIAEVRKSTCIALQKLLTMIMELDESKKKAEKEGYTTRADGVRTLLIEIILDELTYDVELLSPFLQAFNEPKWKLEIVLQYFTKYKAKPSVRTRRSNSCSTDDATFGAVLKTFSNNSSTKSIIKKIGVEVLQLLLIHAFQAHISLIDSNEVKGSSVREICKDFISAFESLRRANEDMEIMPVGKEALFTAVAILSTKS